MSHNWNTTILESEEKVLNVLTELHGKHWLCRGQSKCYGNLLPKIDREALKNLPRHKKLSLERQSIDLYRSTARFFADPGEQSDSSKDITVLMVLRQYGVPTRLLDWSLSPFVATYFAVNVDDNEDCELWSFDRLLYEKEGAKQWEKWPETTIDDGSGKGHKFVAEHTAFLLDEPPDWFVCYFYLPGFHRLNAQSGSYSLTARFDRNHADAIANLLNDDSCYHLYIIKKELKLSIRKILRENYGIWRGSLFPDSAGAAETARTVFRNYI